MKRYVLKFLLAAAVVGAVNLSAVLIRLAVWQKEVDRVFDVPEDVRVVGIGNSHIGFALSEGPEFHAKTFWDTGMSFPMHYARFRELERRGVFERVKVCVFDCDTPALDFFYTDKLWQNTKWSLPFAWRYLDSVPLPRWQLVCDLLFDLHLKSRFELSVVRPPDPPNWTTWTPERKEACFKSLYGPNWRTPLDWDSDIYPANWRERFLDLVRDVKARCERHGVRLVFVATPLTSDDPGRTNPLVWNRISEIAEQIRGLGCEYYDTRADYADDKFCDAGHVLSTTAADWTRKLYRKIFSTSSQNFPVKAADGPCIR